MDLQLRGRRCLVTGASSGIGFATARMLAQEGAQVIASARRVETLAPLAEAIAAEGGLAPVLIAADLVAPDGPARLAEAAQAGGPVDVLINNAGGSRPMERFDDPEAWAESLRLNFEAPRLLAEALGPAMAERGWGRIVCVTGAIIGRAFNAASPAKAALESWAKSAAISWADRSVTVNCIAPGRLESRQIHERLHPTPASREAYIAAHIPAGRFGTAEEGAAVICFLASEPARYVTGVTIPVDGGTMRTSF